VQRPKFAPNITKENGALGGLLFGIRSGQHIFKNWRVGHFFRLKIKEKTIKSNLTATTFKQVSRDFAREIFSINRF